MHPDRPANPPISLPEHRTGVGACFELALAVGTVLVLDLNPVLTWYLFDTFVVLVWYSVGTVLYFIGTCVVHRLHFYL